MKRGFTLLEVLVASILLGMLMTILTMIFNQSSIAWRTGVAGVVDLDDSRTTIGRVRNEADNLYAWNDNNPQLTTILSIWDPQASEGAKGVDKLRKRAVDTTVTSSDVSQYDKIDLLKGVVKADDSGATKTGDLINQWTVSTGSGTTSSKNETYTVNVRSAGPDRTEDTYDDIWSYPDEFDL